MTIGSEGGMMGPMVAAAAVMAAAVSGLYPALRMARISIAPEPAASATAEPTIPAKIMLVRMLAWA